MIEMEEMVDLAVPPEDEEDEEDEDMEDYGDEDEDEDEDGETFGDAMDSDPAGQNGDGFEQHNILHVSGGDVSREFHFLSRSIDELQGAATQIGQGTHHM